MIELKNSEPLASGRMRLVFRHPDHDNWIIKVIRPDVIDERWGSGTPWYKMNRRFRHYISFVREIEEYIAAYARYGTSLPFLQTVVGLAHTDYGLGLVLEAALDSSGNLALQLGKMIHHGHFDEAAKAALERFFDRILESDVVVADLHPGNLVYATSATGACDFVMIDGLGVSNLIPFKVLSKTLNRRSKEKRILKLRQRIEDKLAARRGTT
jgi:hypothetical protein